MFRKKIRTLAMVLVLSMVCASMAIPVSAAGLPYFNDWSAATADNKYGFDLLNQNNTNSEFGLSYDADAGRDVFEIKTIGSGNPQPFARVDLAKEEWKTPLAVSFRVKNMKDKGVGKLEYRGGATDGKTRFYDMFTVKDTSETADLLTDNHSAGKISVPFERGVWHEVTIVTDYPGRKGNVFFDTQLARFDLPLKEDLSAVLNGAVEMRFRAQGNQTSTFFDGIQVYHKQDLQASVHGTTYPNGGKMEIVFNNGMDLTALKPENITLTKIGGETVTFETAKGENLIVPSGSSAGAPKAKLILGGIQGLEKSSSYTVTFSDAVKDIFGQIPQPVQVTTAAEDGEASIQLQIDGSEKTKPNTPVMVSGAVVNAPEVKTVTLTVNDEAEKGVQVPVGADGTFSHTFAEGFADGSYKIIAAGGAMTSNPVTLTVENQKPAVSWILPEADQVVLDADSGKKAFSVAAQDADGKIAKVVFSQNGSEISTVTKAPYSVELDLGVGENVVTAKAIDDSGAATEVQRTVQVKSFVEEKIGETITFDNYAPETGEQAPAEMDSFFIRPENVKFESVDGGVQLTSMKWGADTMRLGKKFESEPLTGRVAVEGDFIFKRLENTTPSRFLFAAGGAKPVYVQFNGLYLDDSDGEYNSGDTKLMTIKDNDATKKPYRIKMVWDLDAGRIDLWVDGVKIAEQRTFKNALAVKSIADWSVISGGMPAQDAFTWLDNISFYRLAEDNRECVVTALDRKVGGEAGGALVGGAAVESTFTVQRKTPGTAVVVAALYDANKCLADIQIEELQFAEAGTKTSKALTVTLPENVEGYQLKSFVFTSYDSLSPVPWADGVNHAPLTGGK